MPPPEETGLNQRAILWEFQEHDRNGEPTVSRPVELWVRWDDTQRDMMGADGSKISVDATVVATQDIAVDSIMWEGGFDDVPGTGTGSDQVPESSLMQVKAFSESFDARGIVSHREYGLVFYQDTMPRIA